MANKSTKMLLVPNRTVTNRPPVRIGFQFATIFWNQLFRLAREQKLALCGPRYQKLKLQQYRTKPQPANYTDGHSYNIFGYITI